MARQATVLTCQDIRLEIDGKMTLVGLFTNYMGIPAPSTAIYQLAFLVVVEGDMETPLKSLRVEIFFPGATEPFKTELPQAVLMTPKFLEGQKRWRAQMPMLVSPVVLNPGRIVCKIVHDEGEIETGAGWVLLNPNVTPSWSPAGPPVSFPAVTSSSEPSPHGEPSEPEAP